VFDLARFVSTLLGTIRSYVPTDILSITLALIALAFIVALAFLARRIWKLGWRRGFSFSNEEGRSYSTVQFYERLLTLMEERGLARDKHLTPLEFAKTLKSGQALMVTRAYNRVRFGGQRLSGIEMREIERALFELEADERRS
jgi:hypothetical protein